MKRWLITLVFVVFSVSNSWAVHSVTVTPPSINYMPGVTNQITVLWNINNGSGVHRSTSSSFTTLAGIQIGGAFNSTINVNCPAVAVVAICTPRSEEFSVPANVLTAVTNASSVSFLYKRTFFALNNVSDQVVKTFLINLPVAPGGGAPAMTPNAQNTLKINRETLFFNDRSTFKLIKENTRLIVKAELNFTGTGLLNAVWEYATQINSGQAIFIRLGQVRRYLGAGGRVQLQSPILPTAIKGQYVVRLNILKTISNPNGVEFSHNLPAGLPIIRYTVKANDDGKAILPPLKTLFPLNNAVLQGDTRFNWQSVKLARAYQLELYLSDEHKQPRINPASYLGVQVLDASLIKNKKPDSGLLIPATQTSLLLTALSKETLLPNQTYYWRVVAIDNDGRILSISALKQIRTP